MKKIKLTTDKREETRYKGNTLLGNMPLVNLVSWWLSTASFMRL